MAFKFIILLAIAAVTSAGLVPSSQIYQSAQPVLTKSEESYDPHPQYQFSYAINDIHTGDSKNQIETRDGDVVQGEYSLIDADGYKRTVQYTADPIHGFNAVVNREPLGQVVRTEAAAPVAYAAPTVIKSAPLAYAGTPSLIRSASLGYAGPRAYTQTYAAGAPTLIRSAPIAYSHSPVSYTTQSFVRTAPVGYAQAPTYATSPVYAHH